MKKTKLKICMVGATGVGKTSLVARYVHSTFSDQYLTTIGVKIDTHRIMRGHEMIELMIWDLSGEDEFQRVEPAYLRGAAGCALVIDGTRVDTIDVAIAIQARIRDYVRGVPLVVLLNKADLVASWEVGPNDLEILRSRGWAAVKTSARTGAGVDAAFERLVDAILGASTSEGAVHGR